MPSAKLTRFLDRARKRWSHAPTIKLLHAAAAADDAATQLPTDISPTAPNLATTMTSPAATGRVAPLSSPCDLRLRASVHFESDAPAGRFVVVNVGSDKRAYVDGAGRDDVPVDVVVRLESGLARVTIQAQAGQDRLASRALLVHCRVPSRPSNE